MKLDSISTIIFDLDGTLYQDFDFHRDYIHYLVSGTPFAGWETDLAHYVEQILRGERLEMNVFCHSKQLSVSSPASYFGSLERAIVPDDPAGLDIATTDSDLIYLGDAWAVLTLIGQTLGLLNHGRGDAIFRQTRASMQVLGAEQDLKEAIIRVSRRCKTLLFSNSYQETAQDFLEQIDMTGLFDVAIFSANKPQELVARLDEHDPTVLSKPQSVLAIGDHAWNDLEPLRRLGCHTIWINPYQSKEAPYDITLRSPGQLTTILNTIAEASETQES